MTLSKISKVASSIFSTSVFSRSLTVRFAGAFEAIGSGVARLLKVIEPRGGAAQRDNFWAN